MGGSLQARFRGRCVNDSPPELCMHAGVTSWMFVASDRRMDQVTAVCPKLDDWRTDGWSSWGAGLENLVTAARVPDWITSRRTTGAGGALD